VTARGGSKAKKIKENSTQFNQKDKIELLKRVMSKETPSIDRTWTL